MHLLSQSHSLYFDFLSFVQNLLATTIKYVSRCQVIQRFMVTLMVVVFDELADAPFQVSRQVIVLQ